MRSLYRNRRDKLPVTRKSDSGASERVCLPCLASRWEVKAVWESFQLWMKLDQLEVPCKRKDVETNQAASLRLGSSVRGTWATGLSCRSNSVACTRPSL